MTLTFIFLAAVVFGGCSLVSNPQAEKPAASYEEEVMGVETGLEATFSAELTPASPIGGPADPSSSPVEEIDPEAEKSVEEIIKESMAKKYSRTTDDILVMVDNQIGEYAKGTVALADEMGGGWWLAVKSGKGWFLAAEGNGIVSCASIESFNFPAEIVPECYDQESGEMINRK